MSGLTSEELRRIRLNRAARIHTVAVMGLDPLVEPAAYNLLQTGRSWPAAVWRHFCYSLRLWLWSMPAKASWYGRMFWYRAVKRMSRAEYSAFLEAEYAWQATEDDFLDL